MDLSPEVYRAHTLPMQNHINIGSGEEYSIADLAAMVKRAVGYQGNIETDPAKPDGTPRKLLDNSLLKALGWRPEVGLQEGLRLAYEDFLSSLARSNTGTESAVRQ